MVAGNGLYQSVRNYETGTRVVQTLLSYDESRFSRLNAVAFCGIVELSGEVASYFDKLLAIGIAEKVHGVTTVVESIRIQAASQFRAASDQRRSRHLATSQAPREECVARRFDFPHE